MFSKICRAMRGPFLNAAALASLASVVLLVLNNNEAVVVALLVLIAALVFLIIAIFKVLNRFLEKTDRPYTTISSFLKYRCDDGETITVESYKLIQVKNSMMYEIDSGFKWTGTDVPEISSDLQNLKAVKKGEETEFDKAVLEFKKPVIFNETTVVHFRSRTYDKARISKPYLEIPVTYPVEYIEITVLLGYKAENYDKPAVISKRKIAGKNGIITDFKSYENIPFDTKFKQYSFRLINPEVGYNYRISWER